MSCPSNVILPRLHNSSARFGPCGARTSASSSSVESAGGVPGGVAQFGGDENAIVRLTGQVRGREAERLLGEVRPRCDRAA